MTGCAGSDPICNPKIRGDCERALDEQFGKLRQLKPPLWYPSVSEVENQCHAEFLPTEKNPWLAYLKIKKDYPNHPAQMCRLVGGQPSAHVITVPRGNETVPVPNTPNADGTTALTYRERLRYGPFVMMNSVSLFGNGDDNKWLASESQAGFVAASLTPVQARDWTEAQRKCPDFSPIREVATSFSRSGAWSEALERIGQVSALMTKAAGRKIPTPQEMRFSAVDDDTRKWGACLAGSPEAKTVVVGDVPTHIPSEREGDPRATKQCEPGAHWQAYEYEERPMVALDGRAESFPIGTNFLCLRLWESEPTPLLQAAVRVEDMMRGALLLGHSARNVLEVNRTVAPNNSQITQARENSLVTIVLELWDTLPGPPVEI